MQDCKFIIDNAIPKYEFPLKTFHLIMRIVVFRLCLTGLEKPANTRGAVASVLALGSNAVANNGDACHRSGRARAAD